MFRPITQTLLLSITLILLTSCVTSVDEALPYDALPQVKLGANVTLIASPAEPDSTLSSDVLPSGSTVELVGKDANGAWLLVLHNGETLGWMPVNYAQTSVGNIAPAIVVNSETPDANCARYINSITDPDSPWVSDYTGSVFVVGSIYRQQVQEGFDAAELRIALRGGGRVLDADYVHTPLTGTSALIMFGYKVENINDASQIQFNLSNTGSESLAFQASFFADECDQLARLPIGEERVVVSQPTPTAAAAATDSPASNTASVEETPQPNATPTDNVVVVQDGNAVATSRPDVEELAVTICGEEVCSIYHWHSRNKELTPLVDDEGSNYGASWSPDGSQFVFSSNRSGIWQLYIYDFEKRKIVNQITQSEFDSQWPSWSPIGNEILYSESTDKTQKQASVGRIAGGYINIWKINIDTRHKQQLTNEGMNKTPQWSPDGSQIVFSAAREDTDPNHRYINNNDERHLYIMDSNGKNIQKITTESDGYDTTPYWMPNSEHIIFARAQKGQSANDNGPRNIFILNLSTENIYGLTFTSRSENWPSASSNGNQITYRVWDEEEEVRRLYIADWDGEDLGAPTFITNASIAAFRPQPE